ncbi:MAG TPA: helix-turn-helix domain-containing protein [Ktedonobacteraceae bacterium]|nr:helix-turn-helix domain-containing protein [Ktedonobacteraceae bacterium]HZU69547.1 helix-turn-helix domain-containing protein [Ktedonobacteraceae bacterium]
MRKEQHEYEGRKYLTGAEAAALLGVNPRTIYRMIDRGELVASHARSNKLRIAYDDVLAWKERQGLPTLSSDDRHEQLVHAVQELTEQVHFLRVEIDSLLALFTTARVRAKTQATDSEQQPSFEPHDMVRLLAGFRSSRATDRSLSVLGRRGLPSGSMTVAAFAQQHQVKVNRVKKLYEEQQIALSIISRDNATRNAREWWITPQQQEALVRYWQQQHIPYATCPQCPHAVSSEVHPE